MSTHAAFNFTEKVVVVTGGARGIGQTIASRFAGVGAMVSIWDIAEPAKAAHDHHAIKVDIADVDATRDAAAHTVDKFGKLDILIHSAGYAGETVPLDQTSPASWNHVIQVNLFGTYSVCRAVVPHMRKAGSGRIVNIASLAGKEGTPNASAYSASKAGMIALTKSLGKELAGTGILVNAVAPAAIETDMLAQMSPAHVQTMINKSPLGRLGRPDEIAELVMWLASDSCSFSLGAVFDASGGRATY